MFTHMIALPLRNWLERKTKRTKIEIRNKMQQNFLNLYDQELRIKLEKYVGNF